MAPLPPDGTGRVKIDYAVCGEVHTCQIRYAEGSSVEEALDDFSTVIAAVGTEFFASEVVNVTAAISGSNVFNPVGATWPIGWGVGAGLHYQTAWYYDFIGRSLDGRRVRFSLFGAIALVEGNDYRITSGESSEVAGAVDALNAMEGTFVSINAFQPIWHPYANTGINAYWRNKIR